MNNEIVVIPVSVQAALRGQPERGAWNQMFPLLTVDEEGFPHVCLLSRTELDADPSSISVVVASVTTAANLRRSGIATLIVVAGRSAWYCKLRTRAPLVEVEGLLGARFAAVAVKEDSVGVELRPALYHEDERLEESEHRAATRALLARMNASTARSDEGPTLVHR